MARHVTPRTPRRSPAMPTAGQLAIDSPDPWQSSACQCWPPQVRGCGHCRACDTCQDCRRCAGTGCTCECED